MFYERTKIPEKTTNIKIVMKIYFSYKFSVDSVLNPTWKMYETVNCHGVKSQVSNHHCVETLFIFT